MSEYLALFLLILWIYWTTEYQVSAVACIASGRMS
jgi:hypothetical protein